MKKSLLPRLGLLFLLASLLPVANASAGDHGVNITIDGDKHVESCGDIRIRYDRRYAERAEDAFTLPGSATFQVKMPENSGVYVIGERRRDFGVTACKAARRVEDLDQIRVSPKGSGVSFHGPSGDDWLVFLIVRAPRDAAVDLEVMNGSIAVRELSGKVTARTTNGPISIANVVGRARRDGGQRTDLARRLHRIRKSEGRERANLFRGQRRDLPPRHAERADLRRTRGRHLGGRRPRRARRERSAVAEAVRETTAPASSSRRTAADRCRAPTPPARRRASPGTTTPGASSSGTRTPSYACRPAAAPSRSGRGTEAGMIAAVALSVLLAASTPPSGLRNAKVATRAVAPGGLAAEVKALVASPGPQWIGYSQPVIAGNHRMCCFGSLSDLNKRGKDRFCCGGCALERESSFTINNDDDGPVQLEGSPGLVVLLRADRGRIGKVRSYDDSCGLDAGGLPFTWLTDVRPEESIALLGSLVRQMDDDRREDAAGSALAAVALTAHPSADALLESFLARGQPHDLRKKAAFWTGNSRGRRGFEILSRVVPNDADEDFRKEGTFALSQSPVSEAVDLLVGWRRAIRMARSGVRRSSGWRRRRAIAR